jgi:hypothetical protein
LISAFSWWKTLSILEKCTVKIEKNTGIAQSDWLGDSTRFISNGYRLIFLKRSSDPYVKWVTLVTPTKHWVIRSVPLHNILLCSPCSERKGKSQICLCPGHGVVYGSRGVSQIILNLDVRLRSVVNITPRPLYFPANDFRTHWIGRWVSPNAGMDVWEQRKIFCIYRDAKPGQSSP